MSDSRKARRWLTRVAGAAIFGLGFWLASSRTPELNSVAVLPLTNVSTDPLDSDYLADGISQSVITRLALAQVGLRLTPWDAVRHYRDRGEEAQEIARELNVGAVLLGSFQLDGDRILTRLSLVEASTGLITWADDFEESYSDLFQVQRRIAEGAAASLKRSLEKDEEEALAAPESKSVEAYDLYLQGAYLVQTGTQESTEVAFQYFERALELDPNLADAYVGLGVVHTERYYNVWGGLSSLERAEESYERALELNDVSMRALRGLVMVSYFRGRGEDALQKGSSAARVGRVDDLETLLTRAPRPTSMGAL